MADILGISTPGLEVILAFKGLPVLPGDRPLFSGGVHLPPAVAVRADSRHSPPCPPRRPVWRERCAILTTTPAAGAQGRKGGKPCIASFPRSEDSLPLSLRGKKVPSLKAPPLTARTSQSSQEGRLKLLPPALATDCFNKTSSELISTGNFQT